MTRPLQGRCSALVRAGFVLRTVDWGAAKDWRAFPAGSVCGVEMQGVLRLRICFAAQSKFLTQDDKWDEEGRSLELVRVDESGG